MKRIFAVLGAIAVSLVVGGLVAGWLLLPSLSSAEIKEAVERHTGRTVDFSGRPRLKLWPELAIELRDVTLSNPTGMFSGRFAAADAVRLKVSAASPWRQDLEVSELVAVGARINLVVDSEGRSNFIFERETGEAAPAVPPIIVEDGEVTYLNERSGAAYTASQVDATIARAGLDGPLEIIGAFNWNDQRTTLALYARSPDRLAGEGSPADFTISSPHLRAAFSGRAVLRDGLELAGTVDLYAGSPADLLSWGGVATAGRLPPLAASGSLDLSGGAIRIKAGQIGFGGTKAQGDVAVSLAGKRPHITASLGVDRIVLDFLAGERFEGEPDRTADWSDAPIDLAALKLLDVELAIAASKVVYGKLATGPARLKVGLADGVLDATLLDSKLYGGSAGGRLVINGSGETAAFTSTFNAQGVDSARLIAALAGAERVRGKANVDLELSATGRSQRELAAMLSGKAQLSLQDGALVDLDIPAMLGSIGSGVLDGWAPTDARETPFSRLEARFTVQDGIAETSDLSLRGAVADVAGTGSIDVLRQRLDLKVRPQIVVPPQRPDGEETRTAFPVPVVIEGSWSAPKIYPDVEGILDDPDKAFERLSRLIKASAAELDFAPENVDNDPSDASQTQ